MKDEQKIKIASQSTQAVHAYVSPFTVSMVDIESPRNELSSGTLLAVCNRVFVATARHCIPHSATGRLWILPERCQSTNDGMLGFRRVERHPTLDVAFLELDPESLARYLPTHRCCALSSLRFLGCGRPNRIVTVCGSPEQFVEGDGSRVRPAKVLNIAFSSVPYSTDEFPTVPNGERVANDAVDIFYEYPQQALRFEHNQEIQLTSPKGFSGGGIWDQAFETERIWSADAAKLIGIQSSWYEPLRYSRGIQIIHWVRLLWDRVEECRDLLRETFAGSNLELN